MSASFTGRVGLDIRDSVPDWTPFEQPRAPKGAPNVLMVVWDDVGFGALEPFGGPIETPAMQRIADAGLRYSNFHTTALCSPTRSSLLNGRNATSNNMACITEAASGFPGVSGRIPFENGLISEVLLERGWSTYAVGKWHLTPSEEIDAAGWRGRWPLGRGFERFYGFLGGEANQWYPDLVNDNHPVEPPASPEDGYHLSKDLADQAIQMVRDAKTVNPEKPFFMYYCPGAGHAPHHVPKEWADRYAGRFDQGYEEIRESILARQKELGILPPEAELSAINPHGEPDGITGPEGAPWPRLDFVRPWGSLSADEQRLFSRMAEVFAGFISYTDHHIGRVLGAIEQMGELDNTIVVVVSDNGSSGEGGPNGSFNEMKFFNNIPDSVEQNLARIDELGGPLAYNHYNTGWAWAFDTPFPYWKRFAGYEGGTADPCIISWPSGISERGVREQYLHAVDIVPTVYDLLGVEPPAALRGHPQSDLEGESMVPTIENPEAPGRRSQFYSMLGMRALYEEGWLANTLHPPLSGWGHFDDDEWELYDLASDRSQTRNVAEEHPERLERMKAQWFHDAGVYTGLPLDDRSAMEILASPKATTTAPRNRYVYYPNTAEVPELSAVDIKRRSYTIAAGVTIEDPATEGVLFAHGGVTGGHSLFVQGGRLHYVYNWLGERVQKVSSDREVSTGTHVLSAEFAKSGDDPETASALGTLTLRIDDRPAGSAEIMTQPGRFGLGDGLCVGRDSASSVSPSDYAPPFPLVGGSIDRVVIDVSGDPFIDHEKEVLAYLKRD